MRKWTDRLPAFFSVMASTIHKILLGILLLETASYLSSTGHPSVVARIHSALTPFKATSHSAAIVSGLKKLRVQLMEEEPEGREVANLRFLAKGWPSKPSKDAEEKQDNYKIFNSDPQSKFFHLDPTTGILRIARRIDRDQLCPTFPSCCPRTREEVIPSDVTGSDMTSMNTYFIEHGGDNTPKHLPECHLDLNIRSDDQYSKIILVLVHIVDLNDNAPVWPQTNGLTDRDSGSTADHQMVVHISENSLIGDSVSLTSAYDADIGTNGIVRYALIPEIAEFTLKWTSELEFLTNRVPLEISKSQELDAGYDTLNAFSTSQLPGARHELKLVVKQALDREVTPFYDLTLISFDGGSPSRNTSIPLHIIITDANDNTPKFQKNTYVVELAENSRPHTPVVQVIAVDLDEGVNSRIKYRFSPLTKPEFVRLFNLDSVTGWIHVQWEINYEQYKLVCFNLNSSIFYFGCFNIHLTVEAVDGGQLPRASTCVVEIHVLDENDHAPEIRFEPAYLTNYALVPENEQPGRLVAVFTATDRDSGDNGRVACQLTEPKQWRFENADEKQIEYLITDPLYTFFKLQYMQVPFSVMYKLTTASVFDRELASRITVWITCSDYGLPPRNSSASVTVRITDMNDARPQFARSTFYHSVREDTPVGTTVFVINATDMDEGDNAKLTFWLSGPDMDYFVINENTGQITVRRSLDREIRDSLQFSVHTSDHGTPSLNASVGVLVTITDVNDNPPELERRVELAIFENHTTSMPVGRLTVKDPDLGRNSEVSFTQLQCLAYPANSNRSIVTSFGTLRQHDGSALPVEMLYT
ncbi:Protocadherin alpha-C2 [Paragonimus heterotremus]|uniref:Protocadherin alpha-C2 n=1 Tax=Paragonimus heterotremus TaxID=100268 RepID=A0A8J4WIK3_9TREM|nr:Protocadherin alpha-C2 [Paragonimus heterotremus]